MSSVLKLSAQEAAVILRSNTANIDHNSKRILQKVVDKRTLSDDEVGELEGIIANQKLKDDLTSFNLLRHDPIPEGSTAETLVNLDQPKLSREKQRELNRIKKLEPKIARRKMVLAFRMQHPPMSITKISETLGVDYETILRDIAAIKIAHGKILNSDTTLEMLGQTVAQYDILHGKAIALVDQFTSPMAKAALLRTAISALDSKTRLMGETGVIHRVPERQEILVANIDAGTVKDRVARLIRAQEQRTSKTLELPQPEEKAIFQGALVDTGIDPDEED